MTDQLKPALTAEEWALELAYREKWPDVQLRGRFDSDEYDSHALAALCLYPQPFGFTQEDVRRLRMLMDQTTCETPAWAESLASRIAALLP